MDDIWASPGRPTWLIGHALICCFGFGWLDFPYTHILNYKHKNWLPQISELLFKTTLDQKWFINMQMSSSTRSMMSSSLTQKIFF